VADGEAADPIEVVLNAGKSYVNVAPARAGPGHRSCPAYLLDDDAKAEQAARP
jgi:hypothetical protein